jgi:hypothetical protein
MHNYLLRNPWSEARGSFDALDHWIIAYAAHEFCKTRWPDESPTVTYLYPFSFPDRQATDDRISDQNEEGAKSGTIGAA